MITKFQDRMKDGRGLDFGQDENGLHWAEIRDEDGMVESATIQDTPADIFKWIREHE